MEYDEKQFLDLLQVYKSDETKKARRNLSTISFIIISVWFLKIKLTDVKVFGVGLENTSELTVLFLATFLSLYWVVIFIVSWLQDKEIQKERTILLNTQIDALVKRFNKFEEKRKEVEANNQTYSSSTYASVKQVYEKYINQKNRTKTANMLLNITNYIELYVPIFLAALSIVVILVRIKCLL